MRIHRLLLITLLVAFFVIFLIYPVGLVLSKAFLVDGKLSLFFIKSAFSEIYFREILLNSFLLALSTTALSLIIAYPLAYIFARVKIYGSSFLHPLILLPLVLPPFVGVLGIKQILGVYGSLNLFLIDLGLSENGIDWLGGSSGFGGRLTGIATLQTLHLVPVLYLILLSSLRNVHLTLEEAAKVAGASPLTTFRRVTLPLTIPAAFAGGILVFIASFTDLGTPLLFEYRHLVPVQIFSMLTDAKENPVGYSFIVVTCGLCLSLFFLTKNVTMKGEFSSSGRLREGVTLFTPSKVSSIGITTIVSLYICFALLPHIGVFLLSISDNWFMTVFPSRVTFNHFYEVFIHPVTVRSFLTSLSLSILATILSLTLGFTTAYFTVRKRTPSSAILESISILPLAIPGIVFAFGYIGAFSGTILDNRMNPLPLLLIAYATRRLPYMTRIASVGFSQISVVMEEAARVAGAKPLTIVRRILFPLMAKQLFAGAILTFSYSMLEVSDSLLLALEERFYPVSKAMYSLISRPDGIELASALGVVVMILMCVSFFFAEWLNSSTERKISIVLLFVSTSAVISSCTQTALADDNNELVLVSPHWEGVRREFERAFVSNEVGSGRSSPTLRWLDVGGTSDIVRYIKAQSTTSNSAPIDVLFGGGQDSFLELESLKLLARASLNESELQSIPTDLAGVPLRSADNTWFIAALSTFGILHNKVIAERLHLPLPTTWKQLADPIYKGVISSADPRKSGSMHAVYEIILQGYGWSEGWKIIEGIASNVRNFSAQASMVGREVALGEVVFGISIDTYAGETVRRYGPTRLGFSIPTDYPSINGDGIAVLKLSKAKELANRFVQFVLSEEGQRLWYSARGEIGGPEKFEIGKLPILPSLYGKVKTPSVVKDNPFLWKSSMRYDAGTAAKRWNLVNDLFGVFIIDLHDQLIKNSGARGPFPVSYSDVATGTNKNLDTSEAVDRSSQMTLWREAARLRIPEGSVWQRWGNLIFLVTVVGLVVVIGRISKMLR